MPICWEQNGKNLFVMKFAIYISSSAELLYILRSSLMIEAVTVINSHCGNYGFYLYKAKQTG